MVLHAKRLYSPLFSPLFLSLTPDQSRQRSERKPEPERLVHKECHRDSNPPGRGDHTSDATARPHEWGLCHKMTTTSLNGFDWPLNLRMNKTTPQTPTSYLILSQKLCKHSMWWCWHWWDQVGEVNSTWASWRSKLETTLKRYRNSLPTFFFFFLVQNWKDSLQVKY